MIKIKEILQQFKEDLNTAIYFQPDDKDLRELQEEILCSIYFNNEQQAKPLIMYEDLAFKKTFIRSENIKSRNQIDLKSIIKRFTKTIWEDNSKPLHLGLLKTVCSLGHDKILKELLSIRESIHKIPLTINDNLVNFSLLHGRLDIVRMILSKVDNPNTLLYMKKNGVHHGDALHLVIKKSLFDFARELVLNYNIDLNALNRENQTAMHCACFKKDLEMVKFLIKHGAHLNILDRFNCLPIHVACIQHNEEIIRELIAHGSPMTISHNNFLPIHHIASMSHSLFVYAINSFSSSQPKDKVIKWIQSPGHLNSTTLSTAIMANNIENAVYLLDHFPWPETRVVTFYGIRPLSYLQLVMVHMKGAYEVTKRLLDQNHSVDFRDSDGFTVIHYAIRYAPDDTLCLIYDKNPPLKVGDYHQNILPIHMAIKYDRQCILSKIIQDTHPIHFGQSSTPPQTPPVNVSTAVRPDYSRRLLLHAINHLNFYAIREIFKFNYFECNGSLDPSTYDTLSKDILELYSKSYLKHRFDKKLESLSDASTIKYTKKTILNLSNAMASIDTPTKSSVFKPSPPIHFLKKSFDELYDAFNQCSSQYLLEFKKLNAK
mmetsp:Transcript_2396/g.3481  ORF Transcript_2396/g.3481 Transcript_2396/m.3481 type:complete len:601 (+) Transcript_2396:34-1836(+)